MTYTNPATHKVAAYAKVNKTVYKNRHLRYYYYFFYIW